MPEDQKQPEADDATSSTSEELSEKDMNQVAGGGFGSVSPVSPVTRAQGWIEITGEIGTPNE